jgi:hypothetical protein
MEKTIEILEKSVKFAKKELITNWEKIDNEESLYIKKGLQETMNFIELLKEINKKL